MSAQRIAEAYACRNPVALLNERLPWITEQLECASCGTGLVMVRPIGVGILDEEDVRCSQCGTPACS